MKTVKGNMISMAKNDMFDIIIHGCNCFCIMGAGIAPQIAAAFTGPNGPEEVDNLTTPGDRSKLGTFNAGTWINPETGKTLLIVNAYTQFGIAGENNECPVDYDAVRDCFAALAKDLVEYDPRNKVKIAYPMIGAGLGGGDWSIISAIIDEELNGINHTLVEYDGS